MTLFRSFRRTSVATALLAAAAALPLAAQTALPHRLSQAAAQTAPGTLAGTVSQRLAHAEALGHLPGTTVLQHLTLVLQPSAEQEAALDQLLLDQANPASSSYHQWLTPAQFGARFGMGDDDLAILRSWLLARGLSVESVATSRNSITFSGTAAAVEAAFNTTLQQYRSNGQQFFANSAELSLPSGLLGAVRGVRGLNSYRLPAPAAHGAKVAADANATPLLTGSTGSHYLTPWDFRQIYSMNGLVGSGFDGTGIKIAVIGQSAVSTTQIGYFQTLTGQTAKAPTLVLVPNTGTSTAYSGDEGESEIDIEYAGGSAPGASIVFVYTGSSNTAGVFDALAYALTNNVAPIITMSYGSCEADSRSDAATLEPDFKQGNAQGQTVLISSGDSGAATCDQSDTTARATQGLTVSYPASSPYVTGVGGTQLNGDTSTYWSSTNNSYRGSALGYIPEVSWNDSVAPTTAVGSGSFSSGGGGYSKLFAKPSWQAGTGVPADGHRDVPDVSFSASPAHNGYVICSAEVTNTTTGATDEACTATTFGKYVFGGTSLSSPNFAAMLALIEQANGSKGLGNINASLYTLAAGTSAASIFHDVTTGTNQVVCQGGSTDCSSTTSGVDGTLGYTAGVGYDQATGLGSIVGSALQTALKAGATASTLSTPTVTLSGSLVNASVGTADTFSVVVAGNGSTPTGTVTLTVDGTAVGSAATLAAGATSFTYTFATSGAHTVVARYSGDTNFAAASATLAVTVVPAVTGSFTLASSPATLSTTAGVTGTETLTLTSVNGFADTVALSYSFTASSGAAYSTLYGCAPSTLTVKANATLTAAVQISTVKPTCTAGAQAFSVSGTTATASAAGPSHPAGWNGTGTVAAATLALLCCAGLRRRRGVGALAAVAVSALAFGMMGCGNGGTAATTTTSTTSTYAFTVKGTSSVNSALTASTTFTFAVN